MDYKDIIEILKEQVKPALGCTEPAAVAIAVARAYKEIKGDLISVSILLSPNIYKNGMRVGIPGTSEVGIPFAVVLAIVAGNSDMLLEVFANVKDEDIKKAKDLLDAKKINVEVNDTKGNFYIEANVKTSNGESKCIIKDSHTNIVLVKKNGKVVYEKQTSDKKTSTKDIHKLGDLTLKELRETIENLPIEDIEFLLEGAKLNKEMANTGLKKRPGLALGAGMMDLMDTGIIKDDLVNKVRIYTAAATDARMAGIKLPVMSSAGSGNHGITAIVPAVIVAEELKLPKEKLIRALAFSHIVTIYIKEFTGKLSPVCGCSIAAGVGASASVAWLLGCDDLQIAGAIKNMIGNLAGMLCDGAKGGCAFKLSTASSEAVISAQLAKAGVVIKDLDGIVGLGAETTIRNLGKLCAEGLNDADTKIIEIMIAN